MYRKFITPVYLLNIIFQSIFSLLTPIALMTLIAWLLNARAGVGSWIFVVLIMLGVFTGLYSMLSFILSAMRSLERLEQEREARSEAKSRGKDS